MPPSAGLGAPLVFSFGLQGVSLAMSQIEVLNPDHTNGNLMAIYYAPWCPFSQRYWETIAKVVTRFPALRAVALDVSLSPGFTLQHGIAGLPAIAVASARRARLFSLPIQLDSLTKFVSNVTQCSPTAVAAAANLTTGVDMGFEPTWDSPEDDWALRACLCFLGAFALAYIVLPPFRAWYQVHGRMPAFVDSDSPGLWP